MQLHLEYTLTPTPLTPSPNTAAVAGMFGLGGDPSRTLTLVPPTTLDVRAHQLIFLTGPSGGGKSTLLRLLESAARSASDTLPILCTDQLDVAADLPLVDTFPELSLDHTLRLLSLAGLSDAFVMLRRPNELSDGQHDRYRLARLMAKVETLPPDDARPPGEPHALVLADEFGATLDRVTAAAVACRVRRWVTRVPVCFVAATTHDDLLEPLAPDVLIDKGFGSHLDVIARSN